MNTDYYDLKQLQASRGYQKLQALWAHEGAKLLDSLQKVASKNNESNWRYTAGKMAGFDLAITHLERAILQMEKEGETGESPATEAVEALMKEIRGEKP